MEQAKLEVQRRESSGKGAARATRRAGFVPAVVYGHKQEVIAVKLPQRDMRHFLGSSGDNIIINMELGDEKPETVMLKEVQIDPVSREIVHVDFVRVSLEERVTTHVPIVLLGKAPGTEEGGIQEFLLRELQIECEVGRMPDHIDLDISSLEIGDRVRVEEIELEEGMVLVDAPSTIIVAVVPPTVVEIEEEEEGLEGELDEDMEPEVIGEKRDEEEEEEE